MNTLFLESNFERLRVAKHTRQSVEAQSEKGVRIFRTQSGIPSLTVQEEPVYDSEDPISNARRQVAELEGDDSANVVALFGFGLGYHAEQLERRFSCPIIVYDPSITVIRTVLGRRLLNLERTILVADPAHLVTEVQPKVQFNDRKIIAAAVPAYRQLFPEAFTAFVEALERAVSNARIMEHTVTVRADQWIRHGVENVLKAADRPGIDLLCDKFEKVPGIIVSAGPSLDRNIDALKAAQGKALIASVNAAAAPLARAGIKPDLIAVVEGLDLREQLADLPWLSETTLAPTLNCFPGFFDMGFREIFTVADQSVVCSDWFVRAYKRAYFSSGGSVSCSTFSLLYSMGCDPIIVIGQDLAYTNGLSYSANTTFGKQTMAYDPEKGTLKAVDTDRNPTIEKIRQEGGLEQLTHLEAVEVEAYGGNGTVPTIGIYNLFRSWFENSDASWAKKGTLINATEGGARISGFQEMTLADAVAKHCTVPQPIRKIMDDAVAEAPKNNISALADAVAEDMNTIDNILHVVRKASAATKEGIVALNNGGMTTAEPALRRLSELESELRRLTRTNRIIDAFVSGEVNRLRRERYQDKDADISRQTAKSLRRTDELLHVIDRGCKELKTLFAPVISSLRERKM